MGRRSFCPRALPLLLVKTSAKVSLRGGYVRACQNVKRRFHAHHIRDALHRHTHLLRTMPDQCAFCGTTNTDRSLQKCSGCRQRKYCNQACQRAAWQAGHREECRQLRDTSSSSSSSPSSSSSASAATADSPNGRTRSRSLVIVATRRRTGRRKTRANPRPTPLTGPRPATSPTPPTLPYLIVTPCRSRRRRRA